MDRAFSNLMCTCSNIYYARALQSSIYFKIFTTLFLISQLRNYASTQNADEILLQSDVLFLNRKEIDLVQNGSNLIKLDITVDECWSNTYRIQILKISKFSIKVNNFFYSQQIIQCIVLWTIGNSILKTKKIVLKKNIFCK